MVRVQLIGKFQNIVPGNVYTVYGHKWTAYPDGRLISEIDPGFIPSGVAAKRFFVVDEEWENPESSTKGVSGRPKNRRERKFAERAEELFSGLDFDSLQKWLDTANDKAMLFAFLYERHAISLPPTTKRKEIIEELMRLFKLEAGITDDKDID